VSRVQRQATAGPGDAGDAPGDLDRDGAFHIGAPRGHTMLLQAFECFPVGMAIAIPAPQTQHREPRFDLVEPGIARPLGVAFDAGDRIVGPPALGEFTVVLDVGQITDSKPVEAPSDLEGQ